MPIINNPFNGKLNLDVAQYRISNGDYIDALNVTKDSQGVGSDIVVANILGNTEIPYTLPVGENKVIGFYADKVRDRAYYFLWNSNGYNSILYYNASTETIVKVLESKTDSDGINILNFNPSYKVLSVNIYYRDVEGDIIFFNDGLNPPRNINILANYGTSWKSEYLLVIKAPPIMPAKVVYENAVTGTDLTINNLRNKLFQFSYRFVYDNNEKSVWSTKSIVPLPQQPTFNFTENDYLNNARISVSVSTGGVNVQKIELAFRETTNGLTSDWYLITQIDKTVAGILDNDIFTFQFYNDSIYTLLDIIETAQLQDFVPQKANAAELANGNVLLYSGITEGYEKTDVVLNVETQTEDSQYFIDNCGLLFFATCNGLDSGSVGTTMKVYVFGTGENPSGIVTTLNNPSGVYVINAQSNSGTDIGISYTYANSTPLLVSDLLASVGSALISNGWSISILDNVLTATYLGGFILYSSGVKYLSPYGADNTLFANAANSGYQYAIQYFDAEGRTIGAQTDKDGHAGFNTPAQVDGVKFSQTYLKIYNTPPLEARYYQVLRSNNTTYNKRLFWVSESAYSGLTTQIDQDRFFYIGIGNIELYNTSISSTANVVSYNYTEGDRIKFFRRYDADNAALSIPEQYDYEIVGTVATFQYNIDTSPANTNTYTANGNFLKIRYPYADIDTDPVNGFQFPGTADWQHYEILLYNYTSNVSATQRAFYEFGRCFGIGNPGTENAYHIGLEHTQSADAGPNHYATISGTNGDLFYRKRRVLYSDNFNYTSELADITTGPASWTIRTEKLDIPVSPTIDNASYLIQTQVGGNASLNTGDGPLWSDTGYLFYNKSVTNSKTLSIKGTLQVQANHLTSFSFYAIVCTNIIPLAPKFLVSLLPLEANNLVADQIYTFDINKEFNAPPSAKIWLVVSYTRIVYTTITLTVSPFNFDFSIIKNNNIEIIESSFNDTYNLVTNSNGRPSVIDENAAKRYFPTLIRFGQAYQFNTNINGTNRFYYENFDEYDRSFGDVIRLHVRDRYLKVYQKFKVGNVPILTQILKDSANNPLQANTDVLINKIQYYSGDYGIGDAATSLAWNNFADYFVDNYRGVVCRLSQDGITPISITNHMNAFFVATLSSYRQELNNGITNELTYLGNPCIYGVFDAYTNKYIISMEEINRYITTTTTTTTIAPTTTTTTTISPTTTTTSTTTAGPTTTTTQPQVWYNLYDCSTGVTVTSRSYTNGTFLIGDRVTALAHYYVIASPIIYSDPGGLALSITGTGFIGCPATTTTTTTIPPLEINVTISCDNTQPGATFLGKATVSITGGSGSYILKAGYVPTYSTYVTATSPFVITSPTAPYNGTLGLRDTTGGSDKFLVQVEDSFGTITNKALDINCTIPTTTTTTTTAAPTTTSTTTIAWNSLAVYYGISLPTACSALYPTTIYYQGSLVSGVTIFYTNTTSYLPVDNGYYNNTSSGVIYVVTGSEGHYTSSTICPTTTSTTTTTTIAPPSCVDSMIINATSAGTFTFYDCLLVQQTIADITVGNNTIEGFCISTTSAFGGTAVYTIVSWGTSCTLTTTTTTTTAAPTTTTTTAAPTTTTTTSTTTTTLPPVNFSMSYTCAGISSQVTASAFTGGAGTYQISTQLYTSEAGAYGGVFIDITTSKIYPSGTNQIYWVALRDKVNITNVLAKSITPNCTTTTTTTTTTCSPIPNWVNNGAVFCSACVSYQPQIDTNPCSPTYNTTRNVNLGAGSPCDYTANWVNNGAVFCSSCVSYQPQIDTNPCSATYNTTRNVNLGAGAPCNYTANWVNSSTTCVGFDLYNVEIDNNPCSPTYNTTRVGSLIQANSPTCGYLDPVTCDITAVCTGNTQTITLNNFAGGNGTYFANNTTYDNPSSAASGATSVVSGGTVTYTNQPSGTRYVYVTSGYRNIVKSGGNTCTTTTTTTTTAAPTTTTTTLPPGFKVSNSSATLCSGGGSSVTTITYSGGTTICNSTSISASSFGSLSAGNYFIFEPSLGYVGYNKPGGIGTTIMNRTGGSCTAC
jgi:hypothetical protein